MNTILLIILIILLIINLVLSTRERNVLLPKKKKINVRECTLGEQELKENDKKKMEQTKKAFENLMGYGYEDAIKRK